jgi:aldehyde dehydrogenase (NAD(P)+)
MNRFQEAVGQIGEQECREINSCLRRLQAHKKQWAALALQEKGQLLQQLGQNLAAAAPHWVNLANRARQIDPHSPWAAEEWYEIFTVARAIHGYADTLTLFTQGSQPRPQKVWTRPSGQVVAQVFPTDTFDWLLFNGMTTEVWMQPAVTLATLPELMGAFYRQEQPSGSVALVLGAGNVNSIPALDVLDRIYGRGQVVLLKLSPVNAYLRPVLEAIFAPLLAAGFLAIAAGDAAMGSYLAYHPEVDEVHLTGSADTYRAIMRGRQNGQIGLQDRPLLDKPITTELGGITPVIVLPGRWTAADIQFQAENIATMKLYNVGCNCISAQLLILPEKWSQGHELVAAVQRLMRLLPPQHAYYPGAAERQQAAQQAYPEALLLGAGDAPRTLIPARARTERDDHCLHAEFFGPTLAVLTLPGDTAVSFLQKATAFCNESVTGNLGIDLIVPPDTLQGERAALDTAVADLKYGAIGLNSWCGVIYRLTQNPWGAYQDPDANDLGSGRGVVHNTLLFDQPQKAVARGRFRPFPRSWWHGDPAFLPKPPWFVTHRQRWTTARRVAEFSLNPSYSRLPGIFAAALRG